MSKVIELTGYCGLYCGDCIRYRSRAADLARELLRELQETEFGKYAAIKSRSITELAHYDETLKALEAIVGLQCNKPCRVGEGCPTFSCKILECCQERGFEGCWECHDSEGCKKFDFLKLFHDGGPIRNLEKIREYGLDKWVEHREKFFVWEQVNE
jgi:hypothetical protein